MLAYEGEVFVVETGAVTVVEVVASIGVRSKRWFAWGRGGEKRVALVAESRGVVVKAGVSDAVRVEECACYGGFVRGEEVVWMSRTRGH